MLGDDDSTQASVTPDGNTVVFASDAANLVAEDTGQGTEIYRHHLGGVAEGETDLVSGGDADAGNDDSGYPTASDDGEVVAFASLDDDLDQSSAASDGAQVYVADPNATTAIERVSLFTPVAGQAATAGRPSISGDGRYVAYEGGSYYGLDRPSGFDPGDKSGIYLFDRQTEATTCVSCAGFGVPTAVSLDADIAEDGTHVVFSSEEDALVSGDNNEVADVFVYDIANQTIDRVSHAPGGGESEVASTHPRIGRYAGELVYAYQQGPDIIVHRNPTSTDTIHQDRQLVDLASNGIGAITFLEEGTLFHAWPLNLSHAPEPVAVGLGQGANGPVSGGSLNHDGGAVAFSSTATNLIAADTNNASDAFIINLGPYQES